MTKEEIFNLMINQTPVRILGDILNTYHCDILEMYEINSEFVFKSLKISKISFDLYVDLADANGNKIYDVHYKNIRIQHCLLGIEAQSFFYKYLNYHDQESPYYDFLFEHRFNDYNFYEVKKGYFKEEKKLTVFNFDQRIDVFNCETFDEARYKLGVPLESLYFEAQFIDSKTNLLNGKSFYFAIHKDEFDLNQETNITVESFAENYLWENYGKDYSRVFQIKEEYYIEEKFNSL